MGALTETTFVTFRIGTKLSISFSWIVEIFLLGYHDSNCHNIESLIEVRKCSCSRMSLSSNVACSQMSMFTSVGVRRLNTMRKLLKFSIKNISGL